MTAPTASTPPAEPWRPEPWPWERGERPAEWASPLSVPPADAIPQPQPRLPLENLR